ncbi:hypothetical protein PU629_03440 [Pullulanibacillus sp. KACC 23026]|uniref:hypothetical protein n=1 Tax=Pullulanibacillus sp. KACC 23026 TaxID=3028315 RepID=UPI0023B0BF18|nr:hypothetical protein [Pullulanibacillus sp. KACC 23026]WEG13435.1 hypothetical protein PU629_03440 [Pullulanibacillus sp. KACC 23026]
MRINKEDILAGFPILEMRDLFRSFGQGVINIQTVALKLNVTLDEAEEVMKCLERQGYIEKEGDDRWDKTIKGNALTNAKAGPGFSRKTAERKLNDFLERVKKVNESNFAYKVETVAVFGSYLTEAEKLGDVDLALRLKPTFDDPEEFGKLRNERINLAINKGRNFKSFMDQLFWPHEEVLKFLKSGCRVISIHDMDREEILKKVNFEVVYPQKN